MDFKQPPIMELFICGLPNSPKVYELQALVQPILHGQDFEQFFESGRPYNFIIRFFFSKKKNKWYGTLAIPSIAIGEAALRAFEFKRLQIRGTTVQIYRNKEPKIDTLMLLTEPYQDYKIAEEEASRHKALSGAIPVTDAYLGWLECTDVFHIGWEEDSDQDTPWSIEIASDERRIVVRRLQRRQRVILTFKNVRHIAYDQRNCLISLEFPPIFQEERQDELNDRLSGLDPTEGNRNIFAYFSSIALAFADEDACNVFCQKVKSAGIKVLAQEFEVQRPGLFTKSVFADFDEWIRSLPYSIAFQLDGLLAQGRFHPLELMDLKVQIDRARTLYNEDDTASCIRALENNRAEDNTKSVTELFGDRCKMFDSLRGSGQAIPKQLEDNPLASYRVAVTPTSVIPSGPLPDETNRVLRQYHHHWSNFLRVEFRDEDGLGFRWDREADYGKFIDERIGRILRDGVYVAGRKFELLAYSSSGLKVQSVWFMSPFTTTSGSETELVTPDSIRSSLGDFAAVINCPARYGARLSQAFSATEPSVVVDVKEIITIGDLYSTPDLSGSRSCFTDGVGTISPVFADEIWRQYTERDSKKSMRKHGVPSAFQIRLAGYKGMLCVNADLTDRVICLRPSMNKFSAPQHNTLEIACAFDRPMAMFLNRYLIMLLETLGVPREPFMQLQKDEISKTKAAEESFTLASKLFERHGLGVSFCLAPLLIRLHELDPNCAHDANNSNDPIFEFLHRVVKMAIHHVLRDLKHRARIPVPNAYTLVGVADEWGYLDENQIYACVQETDGHKRYLEGPVLVSRQPTVHPGDARMVQAVGKMPDTAPKALSDLTNCVVFPCKGSRSLPSMLAGGDLDGDTYNLILDERLHPTSQYEPGRYAAPQLVTIDRSSTGTDLAEFITGYFKNNFLGIISNQILLTADLSDQCMADPACLKMANLHSIAVDFPKTGQCVDFNAISWSGYDSKPDWYLEEEGQDKVTTYRSQRHIGHLYREVQLPAPTKTKSQKRQIKLEECEIDLVLELILNSRVEASAFDQLLQKRIGEQVTAGVSDARSTVNEMLQILSIYSEQLMHICTVYSLAKRTPLSEEEVVAGTIVAKTTQRKKRQDNVTDLHKISGELCSETREGIRGEDHSSCEYTLFRAWIAWKVTAVLKDRFGARSFGLLALDLVFTMLGKI